MATATLNTRGDGDRASVHMQRPSPFITAAACHAFLLSRALIPSWVYGLQKRARLRFDDLLDLVVLAGAQLSHVKQDELGT